MEIKRIRVEEINPAPYNPRKDLQPGDPEYEKLKRSIDEFGYVDPIIWNERTGNMVGGHQRFKVLVAQGATELEVSVVDLDDEHEKALNVALNKISGDWDQEKLVVLIGDLESEGFDPTLTGYDAEEIAALFAGLNSEIQDIEPVKDDGFDAGAAYEAIAEAETRYGDIWRLGNHLLMCGDSSKAEDVARLMNGRKANLVVTDPPYNVAFESDSESLAAEGRARIMNDDMPMTEFIPLLEAWFSNYADFMDPSAAIYVFHPSAYQREFENAMNAAGIIVRRQCIWVKDNSTFGFAQYKFKHEPVFYAHLKICSPAWYGDRKQTTVWRSGLPVEPSEPETVWEVGRGDVSKYVHPTQKPLPLLEIPIQNSSRPGDLIVDLFGGSAATLMTCDQMGRECRTMELDPKFCDVIKKRYFEATGIDPILLSRIAS